MKSILPFLQSFFCQFLSHYPFWGKGKNKDSKIPASGGVDQDDLAMKEYDFDKNTETMEVFGTLKGMYL